MIQETFETETREDTSTALAVTNTDQPDGSAPLFAPEHAKDFRTQWEKIQTNFVDEPRKSVEQADQLVDDVIKRLEEVFAEERNKLESEWGQNDKASTEDLRMAFRRYRSFFDRLLSV